MSNQAESRQNHDTSSQLLHVFLHARKRMTQSLVVKTVRLQFILMTMIPMWVCSHYFIKQKLGIKKENHNTSEK